MLRGTRVGTLGCAGVEVVIEWDTGVSLDVVVVVWRVVTFCVELVIVRNVKER